LPWAKLQKLGAAALLLSSAGFFLLRAATSPAIPFVVQDDAAPWIMEPLPVAADLHQWGHERVPVIRFSRQVHYEPGSSPVTAHVRAMRGFTTLVDHERIPGGHDDGSRWRDERVLDLTPHLHPGDNEIGFEIRNSRGPALLSLRIEGLDPPVRTDSTWSVFRDDVFQGLALPADDTRRNPAALAVETPLEALLAQRDPLLLLFLLGLIATLTAPRWWNDRMQAALPRVVAGIAIVAWGALFFEKFIPLPVEVGFDARHHLHYVEWLRTKWSLPRATDGWSVYHPPFFYAVAAICEWAGEAVAGSFGGKLGIKWLPFAGGLANVWIAAALCRRLFPDDRRAAALGLAFAAVLPANLYVSAYFSNETFHTALAGAAVLVTVDLLSAPSASARRIFFLGCLLGLGLLTKYTSVIVAAVAAFFLVAKLVAVERVPIAGVGARLALLLAPPVLLAGWFYVRNAVLFGDPLIANWGDMPGPTLKWWQQPGFHTVSFYTTFGESLQHPYLSAFRSFWDSLYSTLWGDGGIAGRVNPAQRHPMWNYGFMSATYLLAIPATALSILGAARCLRRALRDPDGGRRAAFSFVLTLAYAIGFGLLYMSLRLPFFAQAKASYGLIAMAPLAVFFADGVRWLDDWLAHRRWRVPRAVVFGWLTAFLGSCFLSFLG